MDERMEGWIGIPHGGIGMGAIVELAAGLDCHPADGRALYPYSMDFRMGGSAVRVGDRVTIETAATGAGADGTILLDREMPPYISAALFYQQDDPPKRDTFLSYLPRSLRDLGQPSIALPYYRNCFVCGVDRRHPGLKRKFSLLGAESRGNIVMTTAGFEPEDRESFYRFQSNGTIHPITLLALLDETMGWAGFMCSASGGVSVRLSYTFYRPVSVAERLVFIARGEKVKGRGASRILFWSSGGAASVGQDGSFEVVATAAGQFLGVPDLTAQMRRELIPQEWTRRVFELAGASRA
jgi:acyl-coenzyme A thioesterase PaaI-like protein